MSTNKDIVKAKAEVTRVPSGSVQFGDDWPGVFLRGDHAIKVAMCVREVQNAIAGTPVRNSETFKFLMQLATLIENEVDVRQRAST